MYIIPLFALVITVGISKVDEAPPSQDPFKSLNAIDWSLVDFILIPNYEQMELLPWITEYTDFKGDVFVTEPTRSYGRYATRCRRYYLLLWM